MKKKYDAQKNDDYLLDCMFAIKDAAEIAFNFGIPKSRIIQWIENTYQEWKEQS